jgi:uncharacterized protein
MHINLEASDKHSIQSYSECEIQINLVRYQSSVIVNREEIIADWSVRTIADLDEQTLQPLLKQEPKIILIGHRQQDNFPSSLITQTLASRGIGLECMSIGAACRTFNVLLNEHRDVTLGLIL